MWLWSGLRLFAVEVGDLSMPNSVQSCCRACVCVDMLCTCLCLGEASYLSFCQYDTTKRSRSQRLHKLIVGIDGVTLRRCRHVGHDKQERGLSTLPCGSTGTGEGSGGQCAELLHTSSHTYRGGLFEPGGELGSCLHKELAGCCGDGVHKQDSVNVMRGARD